MEENKELICAQCKIPLVPVNTEFTYLGCNFFAEIPTCERCGQVFVSYDLVKDKIKSVETELEDK